MEGGDGSQVLLEGGATYSDCTEQTTLFKAMQQRCNAIYGEQERNFRPKCNTKPSVVSDISKKRLLLARTAGTCGGLAAAVNRLVSRAELQGYAKEGGDAAGGEGQLECFGSNTLGASSMSECLRVANAINAAI